jgi:tetratricopeptide (TPR) repeat protein
LTPERGNAFQKYRDALAEDPTNRRARQRLGEMVAMYRERAETAFEAGRLDPARGAYQRLSLVAEFAGSVFSDGEIDAAAETARRNLAALEVAAERVAAGDRHRSEGRRVRPEADSALSAYREALERHPGNRQALSGLRALLTALNESAEAAAASGRPGEAAAALSDFILVARAAAAVDEDPDLPAAAEAAAVQIEELRIQSRNQRLSRLRERLDRDMERYRDLTAREIEDENVAGQVAPVLRRMMETLDDLADIYEGLPGPEMETKRDRLRRTRAALERELKARAEKAF